MIIMFGDHLPNFSDGFYDEIIEGLGECNC